MMGGIYDYFLYVNQRLIPEAFKTLEEAASSAKPHLLSKAALKIETTWGRVRTWNYRYDLKQWVEMLT